MVLSQRRRGSVRQKFTEDLEKVGSLELFPIRSEIAGDPYEREQGATALMQFLPAEEPFFSTDLWTLPTVTCSKCLFGRAILKAQRKSVAIYSFYTTTNLTEHSSGIVTLNAQGALNRLSEETGGKAFFQGTQAPVSFDPFFKDLNNILERQFALTYLSTHMKKGFYKVQVLSSNPEIQIEHLTVIISAKLRSSHTEQTHIFSN